MQLRRIWLWAVIMCSCAFLWVGCGAGGGNQASNPTGALSLNFNTREDVNALVSDESGTSLAQTAVFAIKIFKINETTPIVPVVNVYPPQTSATVPDIPVGEKLVIVFAYNASGQRIGFGYSKIAIVPGPNNPITIMVNYGSGTWNLLVVDHSCTSQSTFSPGRAIEQCTVVPITSSVYALPKVDSQGIGIPYWVETPDGIVHNLIDAGPGNATRAASYFIGPSATNLGPCYLYGNGTGSYFQAFLDEYTPLNGTYTFNTGGMRNTLSYNSSSYPAYPVVSVPSSIPTTGGMNQSFVISWTLSGSPTSSNYVYNVKVFRPSEHSGVWDYAWTDSDQRVLNIDDLSTYDTFIANSLTANTVTVTGGLFPPGPLVVEVIAVDKDNYVFQPSTSSEGGIFDIGYMILPVGRGIVNTAVMGE